MYIIKFIPLLHILSSCIYIELQLQDIHHEHEPQAVKKKNKKKMDVV